MLLTNTTAAAQNFAISLAKYYWELEKKRCDCKTLTDINDKRNCIDKYVITDLKTTEASCNVCVSAVDFYRGIAAQAKKNVPCVQALSEKVCNPFLSDATSVKVACVTTINSLCASQLDTLAQLQTAVEFCSKNGYCDVKVKTA